MHSESKKIQLSFESREISSHCQKEQNCRMWFIYLYNNQLDSNTSIDGGRGGETKLILMYFWTKYAFFYLMCLCLQSFRMTSVVHYGNRPRVDTRSKLIMNTSVFVFSYLKFMDFIWMCQLYDKIIYFYFFWIHLNNFLYLLLQTRWNVKKKVMNCKPEILKPSHEPVDGARIKHSP